MPIQLNSSKTDALPGEKNLVTEIEGCKNTVENSRGQERDTEEEMPNKRSVLSKGDEHCNKKTKQKEQNKNPSHRKKMEDC